ncbi:hypothetical protein ABZ953_12295 [Streptomyces sp. NPDC046465]|uniref:hypothetical protein n=1 Tax=Streptomyces sp. NPDC046465 TaxID=3155810 RepID=UPI0033FC8CA9
MAWDEWEQLKSQAAERQSAHMQLNQAEPGMGGSTTPDPASYGDLRVAQNDLAKIGDHAFKLYDRLWKEGRGALSGSDKAAADLTGQGFALGSALQHVSTRWDEQLKSLRDACAHIANHMQVTKKLHANDEHYIRRQMSSIDTLDTGFDEQVAKHGKDNPIYGPPKNKDN